MSDQIHLTNRQREYARLYCMGYTHAEIGKEMHVTADTANATLRDIRFAWTGGGMSRKDFYARAQKEGII